MTELMERVLRGELTVGDGAWGTELAKRGLPPGDCPELWNETNPEMVGEVARSYLEAGAEIILTNSFGANRVALARHGLAERAAALAQKAAEISRAVAGDKALVFGSIGPTGQILLMGELSPEAAAEAFAEQATALQEGGADGLVLETMTELQEILIAVKAVKEATGLPVAATMTFDTGPQKAATAMGVTPEMAAEPLKAAGADLVGANCGIGIEHYLTVCERFKKATDLPLWLKPNAGLPELVAEHPVYAQTPEEFGRYAERLMDLQVAVVGGCCGTTPDHVRLLRRLADRRQVRTGR